MSNCVTYKWTAIIWNNVLYILVMDVHFNVVQADRKKKNSSEKWNFRVLVELCERCRIVPVK